jgi:hypothetical protein
MSFNEKPITFQEANRRYVHLRQEYKFGAD